MLLYLNDCFGEHQTGQHPECVERIQRLNARLHETGWTEHSECPTWNPATLEQIERVHDPDYVQSLKTWCENGAGRIEADTIVSNGSWQAALMASGAACDAVNRVVAGSDSTAFCALRPPGHHAIFDNAMGFCLLNTVAVAAHQALTLGLDKVLIVDWDVHHGNGTQDAFYDHGRVGFFSIHRSPFYPGTGSTAESGTGPGLGMISNAPVPANVSKKEFFETFERGLEDLATKIQPELILVSAGFDAHVADPVGSLCLVEEDFAELTQFTRQIADSFCGGKIVSLLEGGYHLDHMPSSALAHIQSLAGTKDSS